MIKITYPPYPFKTKNENDKPFIFDAVRRQWVAFTPEEWVRQNFLQYLLSEKNYPAALIAVEKEIKLGELTKRCDIVVYDNNGLPQLIVECKAMEVELSHKTLDQIIRYNIATPVPYLFITNGHYCFGFDRRTSNMLVLNAVPDWPL